MKHTRRTFFGLAAVAASMSSGGLTAMQRSARSTNLQVIAFDAYGTLFDVLSVTAACEQLFPGSGSALAQLWRAKQLQYSLLRSLMGRFEDFWEVTRAGLVYAARSLHLDLTADRRDQLMEAYLHLAAFPDVRPGLEALKKAGLRLVILSNGEPKMLRQAVESAGLTTWIEEIISASDVRIFKPSPSVYRLIGQRARITDEQIGFVSSNSWDVNGAGAAGLNTFWIQRAPGEPQEELGFSARSVVSSITDLASRV